MIGTVTAILTDMGLLRAGDTPRYHVGLTTGDTLWLQAFVRDEVFYHVKAAEWVSLDKEVASYHNAWAIFEEFMPRPLGYRRHEAWDFFITEGVSYRPMLSRKLLSSARSDGHTDAISRFFETASRAPAAASKVESHSSFLAKLEERFKDSRYASVLIPWAGGPGWRELEALGSFPQHGDFVMNNLGLAPRGLIVLDWEDFGKIHLPGLDLCTLVASSLVLEVAHVGDLVKGKGWVAERLSEILRRTCSALGIETALFWRLFPLYLLAFLYLKDDYSVDVRRRIEAHLNRFCGASDH